MTAKPKKNLAPEHKKHISEALKHAWAKKREGKTQQINLEPTIGPEATLMTGMPVETAAEACAAASPAVALEAGRGPESQPTEGPSAVAAVAQEPDPDGPDARQAASGAPVEAPGEGPGLSPQAAGPAEQAPEADDALLEDTPAIDALAEELNFGGTDICNEASALSDQELVSRLEEEFAPAKELVKTAKESNDAAKKNKNAVKITAKQLILDNERLVREARERFSQPGRRLPIEGKPTWGTWTKNTLGVTDRYVRQLLSGGASKPKPKTESELLARAGMKLARAVAVDVSEGKLRKSVPAAKDLLEAVDDADHLGLLETRPRVTGADIGTKPNLTGGDWNGLYSETSAIFQEVFSSAYHADPKKALADFMHYAQRLLNHGMGRTVNSPEVMINPQGDVTLGLVQVN